MFISNFMKHIMWWQVEKLMTDELKNKNAVHGYCMSIYGIFI